MEKFLNLDFFNLKAEYIDVIVFVWSIFKCSVIFILSIKLIRWLSDKVFKKITSKIDSNERKSQLLTLKEILLHTLEGIFFVIYIGNLLFLSYRLLWVGWSINVWLISTWSVRVRIVWSI